MKKTFLILVLFLLGISFFEAKAVDCPPGYTQRTFTTTIQFFVEGSELIICDIEVTYCYKNNGLTTDIILQGWVVPESCLEQFSDFDFSSTTFKNYLFNKMIENLVSLGQITIFPCGQSSVNLFEVKNGPCWVSIADITPNGTYYKFAPCNIEGACYYSYIVCFDYNFSPPKLSVTFVNNGYIGPTPECPNSPLYIGNNTCVLFCNTPY